MTTQLDITQLYTKANDIRQRIISMIANAGSGHPAGSLDLADIFAAFYFNILKHDPKNPDWDERDILILSNGHCVPAQYAAMALSGYFPEEELLTLRKYGSRLQGHPERTKLPGIETTSGPLGSGISQAAGMASAIKMNDQKDRWVYCVTSDGEHDEGNTWEGIMYAAKYKLSNLIVIVDRNNIQINGSTEGVMPLKSLSDKYKSFNWHVQKVDGHDIKSFINACNSAKNIKDQPSVIIAHTIPGKGVGYMENNHIWHGLPPGKSDIESAPPKSQQVEVALEQLRKLNYGKE